ERIAVLRYDGRVSAVSNVCAHQHGPLGEGKVVDGCLTCPWHGYQYHPHNGQSPPPYTEKIPTYQVKIEGTRILVNPKPLPPGTPVEPAKIMTGDAPEVSPPPPEDAAKESQDEA
ncbi:MAG: Rieske 2Fe-2S domain-containing protein, partial [Planctomycetota bacterium]